MQCSDASEGEIESWLWDFGNGATSSERNPVFDYTVPGTYSVKLIVTGPGGTDNEVKTDYIKVNVAPGITVTSPNGGEVWPAGSTQVIRWTFEGAAGSFVRIELLKSGSPIQIIANRTFIGSNNAGSFTGTVSLDQIPGGDYRIRVTSIARPALTDMSDNDFSIVEPAPVADFTATPTSGLMPLKVTFTNKSQGTITSYKWDFGDGKAGDLKNPVHTYGKAGKYTVSLTVTGPGGSSTKSLEDYVTVSEPAPVAAFSADKTSGGAPLTVQFTDESEGTITGWQWDFGDGESSTKQSPAHVYGRPGAYNVKLSVAGPGGTDAELKTGYITVTEPAPNADFLATPTSGAVPLTVVFTDASTGTVALWQWDFGDGETSSDQHPTHVYQKAGLYTVTLTIKGPGGSDTRVKKDYISVGEPAPTAQFAASTTGGMAPLTVKFTDRSTGTITTWLWDFGDGATSDEKNPTHIYEKAGAYDVELTVSGPGGTDTRRKPRLIIVTGPPPKAGFSASPTSGPIPLTVKLADRSTGEVVSWLWDFGDGATSEEKNPTHIYEKAGVYDVKLTVSGPGGTDTLLKTGLISAVEAPPEADFTASPTNGTVPLTVVFADQSTGTVRSWKWEFGDGTTSTEKSPTHTYEKAGLFDVKLTVSGPGGEDTMRKDGFIKVVEGPSIALSAPNGGESWQAGKPHEISWTYSGQPGALVKIELLKAGTVVRTIAANAPVGTNGKGSHLWSIPANIPHAENYQVRITSRTNSAWQDSSDGFFAIIPPAPKADFTGSPLKGVKPLVVRFKSSSTGVVTSYAWDFGDGATSVEPEPSHEYREVGCFNVKLTVSGPGGSNSMAKDCYINVTEPPPVAAFRAEPTSGTAPLEVAFFDQSAGAIDSWYWEFGDGTTADTRNPGHKYLKPGQYTVTLTIKGPGGTDTEKKVAFIDVGFPTPVAGFKADPTDGRAPLLVNFTDASTGEIRSRRWEFGDGAASSSKNPVHTYEKPGIFSVKLTVSGPGGTDTMSRENLITVSEAPSVTLVAPNGGETWHAGETRTISWAFTGDPGKYVVLELLKGKSAVEVIAARVPAGTGGTGSHTWAISDKTAPGDDYRVRITSGETAVKDVFTITPPAPVADFTASPRKGPKPLEVHFTNTSTGVISSCQWDFGDGKSSKEKNPIHIFEEVGAYTVSLTVKGPGGLSSKIVSDMVTVTEPAPVSDFTATPKSGQAPLTVYFRDTSTGAVTSLLWDFGDDQTSTDRNPSHTYTKPGAYTVKLTVTGPGGSNTMTKARYIEVGYPAPQAEFTASPTRGLAPLEVVFNDASKGKITSWLWDFGDGATSTAPGPKHVYGKAGVYSVSLTVKGPGGSDTSTREGYIVVEEMASFSIKLPGASETDPSVNAYRMIGIPVLPGNPDLFEALKEAFGGQADPMSWRLFRYTEGGYEEITRVGQEDIDYGKAWWIISAAPKRITLEGIPSLFDVDMVAASGYHLVACPFFDREIRWADILADPDNGPLGIGALAFEWDGSGNYKVADRLRPGSAYWVWIESPGTLFLKKSYGSQASRLSRGTEGTELSGDKEPAISTAADMKLLGKSQQPPPPLSPGAFLEIAGISGPEGSTTGGALSVKWRSSGISPEGFKGTVDISYSKDGGKTYKTMASSLKNDGLYRLTLPSSQTQNVLIKVSSTLYPEVSDSAPARLSGGLSKGKGKQAR